MALNRETLGQAESLDSSDRVVLDIDSSESPVHGVQDTSEQKVMRVVRTAQGLIYVPHQAVLQAGRLPKRTDSDEIRLSRRNL
jgi:hypothetical protein